LRTPPVGVFFLLTLGQRRLGGDDPKLVTVQPEVALPIYSKKEA
jgi:hypothetical protein